MSGAKATRSGISFVVVILALVVIVAIGGSAVYYFVLSGPSGSASSTHSVQTSSQATSTTGGQAGYKTYSGTYHYVTPVGPSGARATNNGSVQTYSSVQEASGTFTFFINPANYSGSGVGHGTFTITTSGFCSGSTTFQYSFKIYATTILKGNITVAFQDPLRPPTWWP